MNTDTERLRQLLYGYLQETDIAGKVILNCTLTDKTDGFLRYERVEKYSILFLNAQDVKSLLVFCRTQGIDVWFGDGKLCVGYNFKGNMRLSAYDSHSVPLRACSGERDRDRIGEQAVIV